MQNKKDAATQLVIRVTSGEGIGSQYERVQLITLLPEIIDNLKIKTILEYPAGITKGWDNIHFGLDKHMTIADDTVDSLKKCYPYKHIPTFIRADALGNRKFGLVWSFAVFHESPELFKNMVKHSNKYILIFTPNVLNWGAPLHWGYHLFSKTKCRHPEKGNFNLMTLWGLKKYFKMNGLSIVKTGYFDAPYWPDFAFSKKELAASFPWLIKPQTGKQVADSGVILSKIKQAEAFERKLPGWMLPLIAHHQYVLAQKK